MAKEDRFAPEDYVGLARAFERSPFTHTELNLAAARALRQHAASMAPERLLEGARALASRAVRDAACAAALGERAVAAGSAEQLCAMAWSLCASGAYHEGLFRATCRAAGASPSLSGDAACELYEVHLALRAFRREAYRKYELQGDAVQRLLASYRRHRGGRLRESRLSGASEKIHKDLAEVLRSVAEHSVARQHQTEAGLIVDVALVSKRSAAVDVAIEVDGPASLLRSLDPPSAPAGAGSRVRGAVLLKRHLLQRLGVRVAVVSEDLWRSLGDAREKKDFLRDLLSDLQSVPECPR